MSFQKNLIIGSTTVVSLVTMSSVAFAETSVTPSSVPALDRTTCSLAIDAMQSAMGPALDVKHSAIKSAHTARASALKSALTLTDLTARKTAVKTAEEAFRSAMKSAEDAFKTATKPTADALRVACPGFGHPKMGGFMDPSHMMKGEKRDAKGFMGHMRGFIKGKKGAGAMNPAMTESQ